MSDIAIAINNVSKYYKLYDSPQDRLKEALNLKGKKYHKKFYATKNLNLEIKKGEILGIVGKNGSGKSTLLKLITGVLTPDEGSIQVKGKISALLELGSGFNPEFTGIQNIFFYGTILGFSKQEMEQKLDEILTFADIGEFIHQPLKTYSSGMKSRLGFAVAVHIEPEILILDEVLAVGDALFKRKCYAKMEEFFNGGKTIIYVSHDANSINQLCTRAVFLDSGTILLDSDANTVTKFYQKYIFAKGSKKEEIKQEIFNLTPQKESLSKQKDQIKEASKPSLKPLQKAYLIPNFTSPNIVEYKNYNIDILNPKITTSRGEVVNVLIYGETYHYQVTYQSNEDNAFPQVAFGMDFHNEQGIVLSSVESVLSYKYGINKEVLEAKEKVIVSFTFQCLLPQGTYFTNTGISSFIDNQQEVLNRKIDLFCFKVLETPQRVTGGVNYIFKEIKINHETKEINIIHP